MLDCSSLLVDGLVDGLVAFLGPPGWGDPLPRNFLSNFWSDLQTFLDHEASVLQVATMKVAPGAGSHLAHRTLSVILYECKEKSTAEVPQLHGELHEKNMCVLDSLGDAEVLKTHCFRWAHSGGLSYSLTQLGDAGVSESLMEAAVTKLVKACAYPESPKSRWCFADSDLEVAFEALRFQGMVQMEERGPDGKYYAMTEGALEPGEGFFICVCIND